MKILNVQVYNGNTNVVGINMIVYMKSFVLTGKAYRPSGRSFQKGDVYVNDSHCLYVLVAHRSEPPINMTLKETFIVKFEFIAFPQFQFANAKPTMTLQEAIGKLGNRRFLKL